MTIEKFPLLRSRLGSKTENPHHRPYTPLAMKRLEDALASWDAAQEAGSIENARFTDSKQLISRAVEDVWESVHRDTDWLRSLETPHVEALDGTRPNLSNLKGRLKRVMKSPDSPLRDELIELLKELEPLADAYEFLKANSRKRTAKTEEEREAERFVPPPSDSQAVKKVRKILEQAIDRAYQGLLTRQKESHARTINTYLLQQGKVISDGGGRSSYSPISHFTSKDHRGRTKVSDPDAVGFLVRVLKRQSDPCQIYGTRITYVADDQTNKKSDELAEKETKAIRDQFLYKNLVKLTPLLEAKGDAAFGDVSEVGLFDLERMEGEFSVNFKDGSSFRLRNGVVFVVNQFDTHFHRFPTTFHDVVMPDGSAMPFPSEKRMHKVFAQATSSTLDAAPKPPRP